ncbi:MULTISPECIES: hypothetical protein [Xanthobacter]|uniref:hypothetical protein n=1 Tax=Xanthobacter TaxID=279 RepID=UPI002022C522|nr:hypothetical protein [Xanthobacter aminoxidans]MCL8382947.1 hypothetical protein [Xanthobacter aminoxidans]
MVALAPSRPHALSWIGKAGRQEQWKHDRIGGQDKSGSPAEPQAIDTAWVPACRSVGGRAAPFTFGNDFKGVSGTVWHLVFAEVLA